MIQIAVFGTEISQNWFHIKSEGRKILKVSHYYEFFKSFDEKNTFCLQALLSPEAKNPPNGPIKLENKLTKNPWIRNGYQVMLNAPSWKSKKVKSVYFISRKKF